MGKITCSVFCMITVAGIAATANAQRAKFITEASIDGGSTWHASVDASSSPSVQVRVRIKLEDIGTLTVLGFAGTNMQPTLSAWDAGSGDSVAAFSAGGLSATGSPAGSTTTYEGYQVADGSGIFGRIAPFGAVRQGSTPNPSGLLTSHDDSGTLRFAGANQTTPTTGPKSWGVALAQYPSSLAGTFFSSSLDIVVFKYGITLSTVPGYRVLTATVPLANIGTSATSSNTLWYTTSSGLSSLSVVVDSDDICDATITIPAPGAFTLGILGVLAANRRRRAA